MQEIKFKVKARFTSQESALNLTWKQLENYAGSEFKGNRSEVAKNQIIYLVLNLLLDFKLAS